ncbi:MAG: chemotaxis protein CheB, partial [Prolixibacteraceae bacterium]
PSIDVLFESAADTFGDKTIGIILTGSSTDGALGLAAIKNSGGLAIVQEPSTAESNVLPKSAIALVAGAKILPLNEIASALVEMTR